MTAHADTHDRSFCLYPAGCTGCVPELSCQGCGAVLVEDEAESFDGFCAGCIYDRAGYKAVGS